MQPILPVKVAGILGGVASALMAVSSLGILPGPWGSVGQIAAFILGGLAGVVLPAPKWVEGSPLLQGSALAVGAGAVTFLQQILVGLPDGTPKTLLGFVVLVAAFLVGKAAPPISAAGIKATAAQAGDAAAAASKPVNLDQLLSQALSSSAPLKAVPGDAVKDLAVGEGKGVVK